MPKSKSKKRTAKRDGSPEFSLCIVNSVGPATDASDGDDAQGVYVNLTDSKISGRNMIWFYAADDGQDRILSVAIAAISTGKKVWAWVEWGTPQISEVTRMYLTTDEPSATANDFPPKDDEG